MAPLIIDVMNVTITPSCISFFNLRLVGSNKVLTRKRFVRFEGIYIAYLAQYSVYAAAFFKLFADTNFFNPDFNPEIKSKEAVYSERFITQKLPFYSSHLERLEESIDFTACCKTLLWSSDRISLRELSVSSVWLTFHILHTRLGSC